MKIRNILVIVILTYIFIGDGIVLAGDIVIKGSTSVFPVAQRLADAYMNINPDVEIFVDGGGSGDGIKALLKGKIDIANSSRFLKDSEKEKAVDKKVYPVPFAIAYDCIVPIIHPSNPVENLTVQQLKDIYRGRITNWRYVGGADKRIVVISRNGTSGTYDVWENKVMDEVEITRFAEIQDSNAAVVEAVSRNSAAIGYTAMAYVDKGVKGVTVNGIGASAEAALDGTYPLSRPLYMFTNGQPAGDTLNFINFVINPDNGQKYVKESGYVPLY